MCDVEVYLFRIFFFNDTATTEIYTLSLHDALPIFGKPALSTTGWMSDVMPLVPSPLIQWTLLTEMSCSTMVRACSRSEEHTSELQSRSDLVCRLLLEKKKLRRWLPSSPAIVTTA